MIDKQVLSEMYTSLSLLVCVLVQVNLGQHIVLVVTIIRMYFLRYLHAER